MKIKKIWELYKELRRLRQKVKVLEADLCLVNTKFNALFYEKIQKFPYDTMTFAIPKLHHIEAVCGYNRIDSKPRADYVHRRMSEQMKIKLVDDLSKRGYIRKIQDDVLETYEIKVVRQNNL